jgi:hypothetical protein
MAPEGDMEMESSIERLIAERRMALSRIKSTTSSLRECLNDRLNSAADEDSLGNLVASSSMPTMTLVTPMKTLMEEPASNGAFVSPLSVMDLDPAAHPQPSTTTLVMPFERPRSIAARAIDAPVPDFRILGAAGGAVSSALVPPFVTAPHDSSLLFTAMSGFG